MKFRYVTKCRICNSMNLVKYFDFGDMPLANSFKKPGQSEELKVPLEVMFCRVCANSQLSVVVDPKLLFSDYLYFSSVSSTFREHCVHMANLVTTALKKKLKVLDIASNDGCLLQEFQKFGHDVIGIEPAIQISKTANEKGIPTICEFWGKKAAGQVLGRIGKVDIITATNVFAHVDDVHEFVKHVYNILDDDGSFIIEFPYMRNLVRWNEFDTIYHEHLSYFLVKPIQLLLKQHDMAISDISEHKS